MSARVRPGRWVVLWLVWLATVRLAFAAGPAFLDPEDAFKLAVRPAGERAVEVRLTAAPGYYLYREQLKVDAIGATLGTPALPVSHAKFDETFQKSVDVYRDTVTIVVPVERADGPFSLLVSSQGCADKGLCYPPQQRGAVVALTGFGGDGSVRPLTAQQVELAVAPVATSTAPVDGPPTGVAEALRTGRLGTVIGVSFVAGLLLSLTPCVLPMLPILSSAIVGSGGGSVSRGRGLALAASYSLGMAIVYTAFGIAAGLAGEGLSAALQTPGVLILFATALAALALSMFGVYELQLPSWLSGRLTAASQRPTPGRLAGVFAMGGISALLVSPCVVAPLAGALLYLSQTRDVWLGGSALFALAAGMSVPLLLLGASAGSLLPRAGAWMEEVKRLFGWVLLGVALWTVQSLLPPTGVLAAWGALALAAAATLLARVGVATPPLPRLAFRMLAGLLALLGGAQVVGAATGATNPLAPLAALRGPGDAVPALAFTPVRSNDELEAALRSAGRPVMLDFAADWCVACKEMERYTFADPSIRRQLEGAVLLRADVTANSAADRLLLRRFRLFGPPGIVFFDATGQVIASASVVGYQDVGTFAETLKRAGLRGTSEQVSVKD